MKFFPRKHIKFISAVAVLIVVIFISTWGAGGPVRGFVLDVSSPFLKTFRIFAGGIEGFFHFLGSIGDLKQENEKLVRESSELLAKNALLKDVEEENKTLRKELELAPRNSYDLEAAFSIAQDPQGFGNYIFIDKGGDNGLREGMPVIVSNGILVGKISEVSPKSARVVLITDQASAINGEIEDSNARGIIKGEYGLGLTMDMISQTEVVNSGDTVITSGLGGELPRGLYIGKISDVHQSGDRLFQQASVISPIDFQSLRVVFVIKKF